VGGAAWEVAGRIAAPESMAPVSTTLLRVWELLADPAFLEQLGGSLALFTVGVGIAILCGVPLGLLMARLSWLRVALEDYLTVAYATPMAALVPFIISLLGFGFGPKVLVVTLFAVFPLLFNTLEGARSLKPEQLEVAYAYNSSEAALWRDVLLPYTLPFILTGTRQAIGRGLVGMVVGEFFLGASGIGLTIMERSRDFDMAGVFATILIVTLIGLALMSGARQIEGRVAAWRGVSP
jgi:NitT/TauT family transport system permease protein